MWSIGHGCIIISKGKHSVNHHCVKTPRACVNGQTGHISKYMDTSRKYDGHVQGRRQRMRRFGGTELDGGGRRWTELCTSITAHQTPRVVEDSADDDSNTVGNRITDATVLDGKDKPADKRTFEENMAIIRGWMKEYEKRKQQKEVEAKDGNEHVAMNVLASKSSTSSASRSGSGHNSDPVAVPEQRSGHPLPVESHIASLHEGAEEQKHARRIEEEMACDPANMALRVLRGDLRPYVNFVAMAKDGMEELQEQSPPAIYAVAFPERDEDVSDDEPRIAHSPSSLDGSLPASSDIKIVVDASQLPVFGLIDKEEWDDINAKQKRKAAGGTPPSHDRGRKRFCEWNDFSHRKPIYQRRAREFTQAELIGQFAGI
ncbi:hypothetical protein C8R45DRAFT_920223 [Mycena sanguinolenta]|nr:hypothetical protein C8R45DRAFT_920223 [Mycena sanguinolenta]